MAAKFRTVHSAGRYTAHLSTIRAYHVRTSMRELAQVILMWTLLSTNEKAQILAVAREQTAAA